MDFDSDQESITPQQRSYIKINTTGALWIPSGTTAERPSLPAVGYVRQNTDLSQLETWNGAGWVGIGLMAMPVIAVAEGAITPIPTDGPSWAWNSTLARPAFWDGNSWHSTTAVYVSTTAPSNPSVGYLWVDTT